MPLDWLNTPLDVGDLIARKKRAKSIEALRAQILRSGTPGVQGRLQLADLLLQAGRGAEAVPILIGLADEFARDGFVAKAVAVLKRIDRIDPGRPNVESKLASLARQQHRAGPAAAGRRLPELGIEEIGEDADMVLSVPGEPTAEDASLAIPPPEPGPSEPAAEGEAAIEAAPAAGMPPAEAEAEPEAALPSEEPPSAPPPGAEPEPTPPTEATVAEAAPPPAWEEAAVTEGTEERVDTQGVAKKIRGVFRRFLASIAKGDEAVEPAQSAAASEVEAPGLSEIPPEVATATTPEPAQEVEGAAVAGEPAPAPEPGQPEIEEGPKAAPGAAEPEIEVEAEPAASAPEPEIEVEAAEPEIEVEATPEPPRPEPRVEPAVEVSLAAEEGEGETLSDEAFQDRVLDVIEDVLHQPPPAPGPAAAEEVPTPVPAQLMAAPLLGELGEAELLAVVRGLKLLTFEPGDVIITEGEPGKSLFIVTTGQVKVFVRNPAGRNLEVGQLKDGDFFGEISSLSGRPRTATVTAASRCELLELERATVDSIAATHPRVRETLEAFYIARAGSPEAAAVRAVPLGDPRLRQQAIEALEAHFGESRWDPRMRLRLAEVLLRAGKEEEAVPVLVGLADDLVREGFPEKAIAILKKIERIRRRHIEEVPIAPLKRPSAGARPAARPPATVETPNPAPRAPAERAGGRRRRPATADFLEGWVVDVLRDTLRTRAAAVEAPSAAEGADPGRISGYARGLKASPLFEGFSEEELLAFIQGLRLLGFEAGDIITTEGEPGESLFILAAGSVKVFVRGPSGHDTTLCRLPEGSFFGEISTLSNRPRTATITAAAPCELLELDRPALEAITRKHPRVREVLEEFYIERAGSPEAERIRGRGDA